MAGGRVIAGLMYCDFLGRAGDEVFNQMAKWQAMSAGVLKMPLVLPGILWAQIWCSTLTGLGVH